MRPTSHRSRRRTVRRIPRSVLALPLALALAVPVAVPAATAQELPGSGSSAGSAEGSSPLGSASSLLGTSPDPVEMAPEDRGVTAPKDSPLAFMDPGEAPERSVMRTEIPDNEGLPEGTSVEKVEWISARWVKLYIRSKYMPDEVMKVQIHLARDWYRDPERTFPSIWQLGPLYSSEDESAWSYASDAVSFYADKNVNVVMPIGGGGTFFSDWVNEVDGKPIKWESFLMNELIPILDADWRTNDKRGINGLSMGATSAAVLAARHPDKFNFMASFSGYLDTSSAGMPQLFGLIDRNAGYDVTDMWGPYYSREWREHDPKLLVRGMQGMGIYVAAGNGFTGNYDEPGPVPTVPKNVEPAVMEASARVTSQSFVNAAKAAGVDVTVRWRPNGTHIWPYWTHEMHESWPMAAKYLGLEDDDSSVVCEPGKKFAAAAEKHKQIRNGYDVGDCISEVYELKDKDGKVIGTAQDFRNGEIYLKNGELNNPDAGVNEAVVIRGRSGARYRDMGGPTSWLGWPTQPEDGGGKGGLWAGYENGFIFWHPAAGENKPVAMKNDIHAKWAPTGNENGPWGYPVADEEDFKVGGKTGQIQRFENGIAVRRDNGEVFMLRDDISRYYLDLSKDDRDRLGFPTNSYTATHLPGAFTNFDHGVVYWSPSHGSSVLYFDNIYKHYGANGYEGGKYGFLMEDEKIFGDGSREAVFENGILHMDPDGTVHEVEGVIDGKYNSLTEEQRKALGAVRVTGTTRPSPNGTTGRYRDYEHGVIYSTGNSAYLLPFGAVYDVYKEQGFESGELGFITSDYKEDPEKKTASVTFEGGTLTLNADGTVTRS